VISRTVLIAPESFGKDLQAGRVAQAIGRGLRAGDPSLEVDLCPIEADAAHDPGDPHDAGGADGRVEANAVRADAVRERLDALDFDARMLRARAVVIGARRLAEGTLLIDGRTGGTTFEIATRARQAGVPAYAVTRENALDPFDARILDLQVIVEAPDVRALRRAGKRLAGLV
jgi:glycerate kinase